MAKDGEELACPTPGREGVVMSPTEEQQPHDEPQKRKAFGSGYELWIGLAVGFYVIYAVTDLVTRMIRFEVAVTVDFSEGAPSSLDAGTGAASLSGLTEIVVPMSDIGIADGVGPGIIVIHSFFGLGVVGCAELLRRCFRSGRAVQEELEGLV